MSKKITTPKKKIIKKQKKLAFTLAALLLLGLCYSLYITDNHPSKEAPEENHYQFDTISDDVKSETVRLSKLENLSDVLQDRIHSLEKTQIELKEENSTLLDQNTSLATETETLQSQIQSLETVAAQPQISESSQPVEHFGPSQFTTWESDTSSEDKNVLFEIPAGTVVKAVLVSGADCSVAVQKPTGPSMLLIRPLDNGRLPRKVRVPLKGSVLIGNAIGDIASERVYIRGERLTLVQPNGDFIETEVSAYISGEDGREGMRGVVVDRSGRIITRAGFAAFLQGISSSIQATLNNQTLSKFSKSSDSQSILNTDMFRDSAMQGTTSSLDRLSAYYIKRAEQLQPTIQVAAGRVVDIVFTKTVKIGEADLKKKLDHERQLKRRENG